MRQGNPLTPTRRRRRLLRVAHCNRPAKASRRDSALQALQDQEQRLAKQKQEELQKQANMLKNAFAEAALKERATRLGILDQVGEAV